MHSSYEEYGRAIIYYADKVAYIIKNNNINSLTDYGVGKQSLQIEIEKYGIKIPYRPYDITYPEYGEATESEMVKCVMY